MFIYVQMIGVCAYLLYILFLVIGNRDAYSRNERILMLFALATSFLMALIATKFSLIGNIDGWTSNGMDYRTASIASVVILTWFFHMMMFGIYYFGKPVVTKYIRDSND